MSKRNERPWLVITLGALCIVAIVVAYTSVGQASQSTVQSTRTATVGEGCCPVDGVGQRTLKPAAKVGVNFATSGTLTGVFVSVGDHVKGGELLAEIGPSSAESSLRSAEIE